ALKALEGDKSALGVPSVVKLVEEMDRYIPIPKREVDKPFLMPVEDVFSISGRGTVVTGRIERGVIKVNEEVEIVGLRPTVKTVCTGVEMFRKLLDEGQAGVEMVMPGDNIKMTIELISPIAMEDGLRFAIREGGKTVGAGVVTKILK